MKPEEFAKLAAHVESIERTERLTGKRMVYLSLPSDVFCLFARHCVESGIIVSGKEQFLLFEKPFGSDLASSIAINDCVTGLVPDKQIYRVDHYVAKGLAQALPMIAPSEFFPCTSLG